MTTDHPMDTSARCCDVCLEPVPLWESVIKLCGDTCAAHLCVECTEAYFDHHLSAFLPGLLTKAHCPICLVPMPKHKYMPYVQPDLLEYAAKCVFAASELRCPHCDESTPFVDAWSSRPMSPLRLPKTLRQKLPWLRRLGTKFVRYKLAASTLFDYIRSTFSDYADVVYMHTLQLIHDPERRATFAMYELHKTRLVFTPCCGKAVCFGCKTAGHHEICDAGEASERNTVVLCPECNIPIVRGDGCDSIKCVCDTYFSWQEQVFVAEERSRNARFQAVLRLPHGARSLKRVLEYCRHLVWRSRFLDVVWHLKVHRFRCVAWPVLAPRLRACVQHRRFNAVLGQLRSTMRHRSLCREIHARVCRIEAVKTTMALVLHEMRIATARPSVQPAAKLEVVDDTAKAPVDYVMAAMA
ncbi:hypothetical protein SDRG_07343 [Saprolegnia diclina VS20]|uniref:RING-type domain-containing protein n=1 Tax=Saprolegnia diclina (strain VS20) TaxID=1156394 RepID=T0QB47_SAPDV|nr:hypothetical protein SDRG_07343 [Saprolegnia diclina VS20]EQC35109.1 hypothetical protein SDRG_07343 [Saprolegnia diclina VS20]|eukprot:XP_008611393.1 hypothetical protein SDRG_07343 [Saprolegnia diclina VS20]